MASRDPAFLWETEVLREARDRGPRPTPASSIEVDEDDWLTVKEASEATGIPSSTIRKWARHHGMPSFLEQTSTGYLRMVSMTGLRRRAEWLGRPVTELGEHTPIAADDEPVEPSASEPPEGSMLVPLDAWNRMLRQLGNLHEAGQQLAEARERAARAETEAMFLKERLADLRVELDHARSTEGDEPVTPGPRVPRLARRVYRAWRAARRS